MRTVTLKGKFKTQYKPAAQWSAADTVLLRGEIGVESDTRKFKFGDGATPWNKLGYAEGAVTEERVKEIKKQIGDIGSLLDTINGE